MKPRAPQYRDTKPGHKFYVIKRGRALKCLRTTKGPVVMTTGKFIKIKDREPVYNAFMS